MRVRDTFVRERRRRRHPKKPKNLFLGLGFKNYDFFSSVRVTRKKALKSADFAE
jgi:hypothetical protein